jgi:hypothetical protein
LTNTLFPFFVEALFFVRSRLHRRAEATMAFPAKEEKELPF